jgi:hypothetical protein
MGPVLNRSALAPRRAAAYLRREGARGIRSPATGGYLVAQPDNEVVVIGGGQASLAIGYFLKRTGQDFVISLIWHRPS